MSTFLVMLREGAEAALIVAILLAYLRTAGAGERRKWVWAGVGAALAVSVGAGAVVFATVGGLEGRAEKVVEAIAALAAAGLLTWMIFWMTARSRDLRARLEADVDTALAGGGGAALAAVAFFAVLREGLESALFLISTTADAAGPWAHAAGGLAGVGAAVVLGALVYWGGRSIDIRLFFRVTGALILLFAAGLAGKAVHEFQEAGLLPVLLEPVWELGSGEGAVARVAMDVFGWSPAPSLLRVLAYWAFLIPVGAAFWRRNRMPRSVPAPAGADAG